jgi:hypothetical protein
MQTCQLLNSEFWHAIASSKLKTHLLLRTPATKNSVLCKTENPLIEHDSLVGVLHGIKNVARYSSIIASTKCHHRHWAHFPLKNQTLDEGVEQSDENE